MPGKPKKPTRSDRAMNADEVECKIDDAAGSIFAVLEALDEEANPQLFADWRNIQTELEALKARAQKLGC